jgi:hypothetical protein
MRFQYAFAHEITGFEGARDSTIPLFHESIRPSLARRTKCRTNLRHTIFSPLSEVLRRFCYEFGRCAKKPSSTQKIQKSDKITGVSRPTVRYRDTSTIDVRAPITLNNMLMLLAKNTMNKLK